MGLYGKIAQKIKKVLKRTSLNEANIILNGQMLTHLGNLIFVSEDKDESLVYYIKKSTQSMKALTTEQVIIPEYHRTLAMNLTSNTLYGITVANSPDEDFFLDKIKIENSKDMGFLILESPLYRAIKEQLEDNYENNTTVFKYGEEFLDISTVNQLKAKFKAQAFTNYGNLVYAKRSKRFVNKIRARNRNFYSIQSSFIPIFIEYSEVFNPIARDPLFKQTELWKTCIEKNRLVENGTVKAYYLTHKEICMALQMTHFMRFTSGFLYRVLVGLIYADNPNFPSAAREIMVQNPELEYLYVKTPILTISDYEKSMQSYADKLTNEDLTPERKEKNQKAFSELQTYKKISSLLHECQTNLKSLTVVGCASLDDPAKKTAEALCNYLKEAKAFKF